MCSCVCVFMYEGLGLPDVFYEFKILCERLRTALFTIVLKLPGYKGTQLYLCNICQTKGTSSCLDATVSCLLLTRLTSSCVIYVLLISNNKINKYEYHFAHTLHSSKTSHIPIRKCCYQSKACIGVAYFGLYKTKQIIDFRLSWPGRCLRPAYQVGNLICATTVQFVG